LKLARRGRTRDPVVKDWRYRTARPSRRATNDALHAQYADAVDRAVAGFGILFATTDTTDAAAISARSAFSKSDLP
jgi:hypothetical protein